MGRMGRLENNFGNFDMWLVPEPHNAIKKRYLEVIVKFGGVVGRFDFTFGIRRVSSFSTI